MKGPIQRSVTRRRKDGTEARKRLRTYGQRLAIDDASWTPEQVSKAQMARVNELLWAQAHIERALWLESGGQLGDEVSTPRRILSLITVANGE